MFWDSSALVPCFVPEGRSHDTSSLLAQDSAVTIWWATGVECASALEAKRRDPIAPLPLQVYTEAYQRLVATLSAADTVQPTKSLHEQALIYLKQHPLRAADALQLAAAFVAHQPTFVSLDQRLRQAAEEQGFVVLP